MKGLSVIFSVAMLMFGASLIQQGEAVTTDNPPAPVAAVIATPADTLIIPIGISIGRKAVLPARAGCENGVCNVAVATEDVDVAIEGDRERGDRLRGIVKAPLKVVGAIKPVRRVGKLLLRRR